MIVSGEKVLMTDAEFQEFKFLTNAPWRPRNKGEFNAMVELGAQYHLEQNVDGLGILDAVAARAIAFGPDGAAKFPMNHHKMEYIKVHGESPTEEQLAEFYKDERSAAELRFAARGLKSVDRTQD